MVNCLYIRSNVLRNGLEHSQKKLDTKVSIFHRIRHPEVAWEGQIKAIRGLEHSQENFRH